MVLTSPRVATLNKLYQGAMTALACASVRPCAEAAEELIREAAARASWDNLFMVSSKRLEVWKTNMYVDLHSIKVDILNGNWYFSTWQERLIPRRKPSSRP